MEKLKLLKPNKSFENQAKEYIQEFIDNESDINGTGGLDSFVDKYDEWLIKLDNDLDINNIKPGRVPASTYFLIRELDGKLIGMMSIRHELNDYLLKFGGHIGYSIRPTERRKGYATKLLRLGLEKCIDLGINKVLLTCDKLNIASAKTIQKNNGVLENEIFNIDSNEVFQRYWISLKK